MKQSLYALSLGLGLLSTALLVKPASAISVKLLPTVQTVSVGDSLEIDVQISELGNFQSPSLSGFDLSLSYNPNILTFNSLLFGDPMKGDLVGLTNATRFTDIHTSLGVVNFAEVSIDDGTDLNAAQPASFILAKAYFTAASPGTSPLTIFVNELSDENTNSLTGIPLSASVTVAVPEPSFGLLSLGLTMGLGVLLKKKPQHSSK